MCLDLSAYLMELHALWTEIHTGAVSPVCVALLIGLNEC